ncbi:MAG: hypothetical protein LBO02_01600 [Holosporaceae bacterium]|jgi:hypothetical protein|nr:hypothetical protein [Holosporaceae bacterium]
MKKILYVLAGTLCCSFTHSRPPVSSAKNLLFQIPQDLTEGVDSICFRNLLVSNSPRQHLFLPTVAKVLDSGRKNCLLNLKTFFIYFAPHLSDNVYVDGIKLTDNPKNADVDAARQAFTLPILLQLSCGLLKNDATFQLRYGAVLTLISKSVAHIFKESVTALITRRNQQKLEGIDLNDFDELPNYVERCGARRLAKIIRAIGFSMMERARQLGNPFASDFIIACCKKVPNRENIEKLFSSEFQKTQNIKKIDADAEAKDLCDVIFGLLKKKGDQAKLNRRKLKFSKNAGVETDRQKSEESLKRKL